MPPVLNDKETAVAALKMVAFWAEDALHLMLQDNPIIAYDSLKRATEHLNTAMPLVQELAIKNGGKV